MLIGDWEDKIWASNLHPHTKLVAIVLATFYEDGKICNPPLIDISEKASLPINQVKAALDELARKKYIRVRRMYTEVVDGN